jgi:IS5 family transposase
MSASSRSPCWPARQSCSTRSSIPDRLVSLADPDARPMRKGRPRHPTQFGYTLLVAETSAASSPTTSSSGATHRMRPSWSHRCSGWWRSLPGRPARWSATAASAPPPTTKRWKSWRQAGRPAAHRHPRQGTAGVGRTRAFRRLGNWRVGIEARISHLKRSFGLRRTRLPRLGGARTWVGLGIFAYNLQRMTVVGLPHAGLGLAASNTGHALPRLLQDKELTRTGMVQSAGTHWCGR